MLFQMELLNRQCPVPEKERHPAFHGMLLAEGLLGLRVESSEKELSQREFCKCSPQILLPSVAAAKGTSAPTDGRPLHRLASPKGWLCREDSRPLPP